MKKIGPLIIQSLKQAIEIIQKQPAKNILKETHYTKATSDNQVRYT